MSAKSYFIILPYVAWRLNI